MPMRKSASSKKAQRLERQDDEDDPITDQATLAQAKATIDRPAMRESEASPSKRQRGPQANDPDSATKHQEATQFDSDLEARVREATRITHEQPIPDPRATPTREPPGDHYNPGFTWTGIDKWEFSRKSIGLDIDMYQWTSNYADDDPDAIESRMTAENKQAIIDYLGDWCLYDDWDSLVASFSPLTHLDRFQLLLTAVVLKDIFERVVRNPFFYIDLGEDWDGSGSELPPPYGIELNKLFQKMLKVSATDANNWRASTIRLFNRYQEHTESDTPLEGKDVTPGLRSYNIREKCIDQFTTNILDSSSLIAPILSSKELSQDQTRLRYRGIRRCYKSACKMAVRFSLHTPGIRFDDNVTEVAPYKVPRYDPHGLDVNRWVASIFSGPSIYKELLEGRRVVLVLWPATWMIEWHEPPHIRRWRELSADVRKRREEKLARYITDYDRQYRDENGDEHVITASGIVVVEKDGRESPIDSSSD